MTVYGANDERSVSGRDTAPSRFSDRFALGDDIAHLHIKVTQVAIPRMDSQTLVDDDLTSKRIASAC